MLNIWLVQTPLCPVGVFLNSELSNSPQVKDRVERANQVHQDRFIKER